MKSCFKTKETDMSKWQDTDIGRDFIKNTFDQASMPEVLKKDLGPGTYTNEELAEFFTTALDFWHAVWQLRFTADPVVKRSILSFAVEMMPKKD